MGSRAEAPAMKELVIALPLTGDVYWPLGRFGLAVSLLLPGWPAILDTRISSHM